jgi:hypothetical protein
MILAFTNTAAIVSGLLGLIFILGGLLTRFFESFHVVWEELNEAEKTK